MSWATNYLCPAIGLAINTVMWYVPLKPVLEARRTKKMGDLNPLPYTITLANCVGWTIYGLLLNNEFVFWSNMTGIGFGLFYTVTCMGVLYSQSLPDEPINKILQYMEYLLYGGTMYWVILGFVACVAFKNDLSKQQEIFGTSSMICSVLYYAAPLTSLYKIIATKDASSLYAPLICVNATASSMWTIYGFAIGNVNIIVPNVLGVALCASQLILLAVFGRKAVAGDDMKKKLNDDPTSNVLHAEVTGTTTMA